MQLANSKAAHRRTQAARSRLTLSRARHDTRDWQVKRRERTHLLVELGGLVVKAGLVELADDDRAVIFGLMVEAAARLRSGERDTALTLWRRRGQRAFASDEAAHDRAHIRAVSAPCAAPRPA